MSNTRVSTSYDVFDVPAFINSHRIGTARYAIIILCGLVMLLDGLDRKSVV